jgi:hypothetical protein
MCEQTTTSGRWPPKVLKEEVKFEKGVEVYSNLIINGKPAAADASSANSGISFKSSGELGSDLIDLFKPPIVAEFQFYKARNFTIFRPRSMNSTWRLRKTCSSRFATAAGPSYIPITRAQSG